MNMRNSLINYLEYISKQKNPYQVIVVKILAILKDYCHVI